jgi:hypothetical protein
MFLGKSYPTTFPAEMEFREKMKRVTRLLPPVFS